MPTLDLSPLLVSTLIRATVLLTGALLISIPLRRAPASSRHAFWTTTTVALLALPLLQARLPRLELAWWAAPTATEELPGLVLAPIGRPGGVRTSAALVDRAPAVESVAPASDSPEDGLSLAALAAFAWLLGGVGFGVPIVAGLVRARRLADRAAPCDDARLLARFAAARGTVGVRRDVVLLLSAEARTPMTGGVARPVVLLPFTATTWSDDRLDAVLRHELVHVRRADALRQLASRSSVALYWFHPLAWRTARLGARAREQACDEAVLRLGTRPSHYARHLLELADPTPMPAAMPALVRLDHPDLEERVMAILRASPAPASRRMTAWSTLGIVTWSLGVAAAAPAQQPPVPPRAPVAPMVAEAPLPPIPPSAMAAVILPSAPMAPLPPDAPEPPEALAPVVAPLPPDAPLTDCEINGSGYRTNGSSSAQPVRMMTTTMGDTRLCISIRGKVPEATGFIPSRPLPPGVQVTLASNGPNGSQRLELTGTSNGDEQHWFVGGRERPFDVSAAEWRDAMVSYLGTASEKSRIRGKVAEARGEIASARGDEARLRGEIAAVRGRDAAYAGRIASARGARAGEEAAIAGQRAAASADLAELRQQEVEMARQVRELDRQARQADVAGRSVGVGVSGDAKVEVTAARDREMSELKARQQEIEQRSRSIREDATASNAEVKARVAARGRAVRDREAEVRAEREAYGADAKVAEIQDRIRSAGVQGRVEAGEKRIADLQADKRIAEINDRLEPLETRLRQAIEQVQPR